jgi:hypothetical protein
MPNLVKYKTGNLTGSISTGNVALGVNESVLGPTETTGWYSGLTPSPSQYVIYEVNSGSVPKIYQPSDDTQLIQFARSNGATGANTGSVASVLNWVASQPDLMIVNNAYPSIVTNELSILMDGGFTPSYPTTGSTWYDLSGGADNGILTNGPTFNSNGGINFDGVDDYVVFNQRVNSPSFTYEVFLKPTNVTKDQMYVGTSVDAFYLRIVSSRPFISVSANGQRTFHSLITLQNNIIYHIVSIYNGVQLKIYVNGVLTQGAVINQLMVGWGGNRIGRWRDNDQRSFVGDIYSLKSYNRELTLPEILQNYYQAPIVTDGLVFAADAGNLVSYESGSATMYSLTGSSSGSLVNGVGYSSGNGGGWVFDGVDDYVNLGDNETFNSTLNGNTNWSISYWVNPLTNGRILDRGNIGDDPTGALELNVQSVDRNNTGGGSSSLSVNIIGTGWNCITVTRTSSLLFSWYLNGVFSNSSQLTESYGGSGIWKIGRRAFNTSSIYQGNISQIQIYNRALSPSEISQNFNAQRSRFGI